MDDKEKRTINGAKSEGKFTGKVGKIIKTVTAITLSLGFTITATQAVQMYNDWHKNGILDNAETVLTQKEYDDEKEIIENQLEEFKTIIGEYEQAVQNNDKVRMKELDERVEQENYFGIIFTEIEKSIIDRLGYSNEEVKIVLGRDGIFLTKKEEKIQYTNIGTISNKAKVRDEEGKIVRIPDEMKKLIEEAVIVLSDSAHSKGVYNTQKFYDRLISLREFGNPYIRIDESEMERE